MKRVQHSIRNRLLESLSTSDRKLLAQDLKPCTLERGEVLFEPGQNVVNVYFPGPGTIASLLLNLRDGATAETAMIGQEGAVGGVISNGDKPAFTRGVVQIAGSALR